MHPAKAILLDIEGTTTPLAFVTEVLFPYAREHTREYLADNWTAPENLEDFALLDLQHEQDKEAGLDPPALSGTSEADHRDSITRYIWWLMDRDSKATPLKSIQGRIWRQGYATNELKSTVYEDVRTAFEKWKDEGKVIAIYSSGSVGAQKLLFAHTNEGDLTGVIHAYFDTNTGSKLQSQSYARIARELKFGPRDMLFISDVTAELDAAREAGFQTLLCVREGNRPQKPNGHRIITSFEGI